MKKFKLLSLVGIVSIALANAGWAVAHGGGGGGGHGGGGGFPREASGGGAFHGWVVSMGDVSPVALSDRGWLSAGAAFGSGRFHAVAFWRLVFAITDSPMMSSSGASASQDGGLGLSVRI